MSFISFEEGEKKAEETENSDLFHCLLSLLPAQLDVRLVCSGFTEVSYVVVVGELEKIRKSSSFRGGGGFKPCFLEIDKNRTSWLSNNR